MTTTTMPPRELEAPPAVAVAMTVAAPANPHQVSLDKTPVGRTDPRNLTARTRLLGCCDRQLTSAPSHNRLTRMLLLRGMADARLELDQQ